MYYNIYTVVENIPSIDNKKKCKKFIKKPRTNTIYFFYSNLHKSFVLIKTEQLQIFLFTAAIFQHRSNRMKMMS